LEEAMIIIFFERKGNSTHSMGAFFNIARVNMMCLRRCISRRDWWPSCSRQLPYFENFPQAG
jgi:hypothetical protein